MRLVLREDCVGYGRVLDILSGFLGRCPRVTIPPLRPILGSPERKRDKGCRKQGSGNEDGSGHGATSCSTRQSAMFACAIMNRQAAVMLQNGSDRAPVTVFIAT